MQIKILRFSDNNDDTISLFMIDGKFQCFSIEDEKREKKVYGETRIPSGLYEIKLRTEGSFHLKYLEKFGKDFHKGMLHVTDVPGFEYILIHIGNDESNTDGCILVGNTIKENVTGKGYLSDSANAYKRIYTIIRDAFLKDEKVFIEIKDNII